VAAAERRDSALFSPNTLSPPSPTLPPAPRLRAARAHARALAHRISVCTLSSEAPITPGIHGRRGVPPEARIEAPAPSTRRDPRHHQPLPGNTASTFPLVALRIPQIPQGAWTRSSLGVNSSGPYLGSAEHACQRTFEYLRNYPRRGLEPAERNIAAGLPATDVQPHYLRLWGQGLRTPVLFVPRYVVLLDQGWWINVNTVLTR